jgi:hypothetical protein
VNTKNVTEEAHISEWQTEKRGSEVKEEVLFKQI